MERICQQCGRKSFLVEPIGDEMLCDVCIEDNYLAQKRAIEQFKKDFPIHYECSMSRVNTTSESEDKQ